MKAVIEPFGKEIEIKENETILSSMINAGLSVPASCGGNGSCGRCMVILVDGCVFPPAEIPSFVFACQTKPETGIRIKIPLSSHIHSR
ncbi:TPA: hypothetical protein DCX16_04545 [bacterium]|nr:hypothetical protein [bacterium]